MALITNSSTFNTAFVPTQGEFTIDVTGGQAQLERRGTSSAAWAHLAILAAGSYDLKQIVTGSEWRFTAPPGGGTTAAVRADQ